MSRLRSSTVGLMAAAALVAAGVAWGQAPVTATLHPSGMIQVTDEAGEIATINLNAHGPGWENAPQDTATGQISDTTQAATKRVTGTLPVANTNGGAIEYMQTVTEVSQGLRIEYEVGVSHRMRLNGLQLSINLPVARHGGSEVMILQPHGDPQIAGLPTTEQESRTQIWSGSGATVEVAGDTDHAVTAQLRAATDVLIQDLREWDEQVFEVRFPAIMEAGGREVSADDRFHLDLTVTFAGPLSLQAQ